MYCGVLACSCLIHELCFVGFGVEMTVCLCCKYFRVWMDSPWSIRVFHCPVLFLHLIKMCRVGLSIHSCGHALWRIWSKTRTHTHILQFKTIYYRWNGPLLVCLGVYHELFCQWLCFPILQTSILSVVMLSNFLDPEYARSMVGVVCSLEAYVLF